MKLSGRFSIECLEPPKGYRITFSHGMDAVAISMTYGQLMKLRQALDDADFRNHDSAFGFAETGGWVEADHPAMAMQP